MRSRLPRLQLKKEWLLLWLPPALVLTASFVAEARWHAVYEVAGQFLLALAVSSLIVPVRVLRPALVAILVFFLLAAVSGPLLASRIWQDPQALSLADALANSRHNMVTTLAARSWELPTNVGELELSFEARLAKGTFGWDWFRSTGGFELTPLEEDGTPFTRVVTPRGGDPYLMRTFELNGSAGGRTFRVALEMRSPSSIPAEGCRGVWLQTWGPGGEAKCEAANLGPDWRPVELEWTAPAASESSIIRVVLNDFDGLSYDVRDVKLYELTDGRERRLEPTLQEGVGLTLVWGNEVRETQAEQTFVPTSTWQPFKFSLSPPRDASSLQALLLLGSTQSLDTQVEVRGTKLENASGPPPTPVPTYPRAQLWFSHPNLAAHTLLSLVLATLATTSSLSLTLIVSSLAALTVVLIRSRAAWLALLLGAGWFSFLTPPLTSRRRLGVLLAVVILIGAGIFSVNSFRSGVFANRTGTSRLEIWRVAGGALLEHPWGGIEQTGFSDYWREAYRGNSQELVTHAHNLWLEFAAAYGLPGLVAILWLTGGLLILAWRWGRWRGLALVIPVFIMNIFDTTFFYSGVLFPLLLGINALRTEQNDALQATTPPEEPEKA